MNVISLFKLAFKEWQNDKASVWGAALSYYTVFSLSPLLLIIISLAGLIFGRQAVEGSLYKEINGLLGSSGAVLIQQAVENANKPTTSIVTTIIGFVTLLLGASGVFGQLKEALNAIFDVSKKSSGGVTGFVFEKLLSFSMVGVIGFLLMISLVASAVISGVNAYLNSFVPFPEYILEIINFLVSFFIIAFLFGLIYKLLPDVKIPWKYVWRGGAITSLLFVIGKTLLGFYLGVSSIGSAYGAAAYLIIILVWVYYTAQIFFFGAEFTQVYALSQGVALEAKKGAVIVSNPLGAENEKLKKRNEQANKKIQPFLAYAFIALIFESFRRLFKKK